MFTRISEHCFHQVGRAVCSFGLIGEVRLRRDKHAQLDDPLNTIKVTAQRGLHLRDQHDAARLGGDLGIFKTAGVPNAAG